MKYFIIKIFSFFLLGHVLERVPSLKVLTNLDGISAAPKRSKKCLIRHNFARPSISGLLIQGEVDHANDYY